MRSPTAQPEMVGATGVRLNRTGRRLRSKCLRIEGGTDGPPAERPFLKDGRGDWRSFEPYPQVVAPILAVFDGPKLPWITMIGHLIRSAA